MHFFNNWIQPKSYGKIGFEDVKTAIKYPDLYILINTLSLNFQKNVIKNTIAVEKEEIIINNLLENYELSSKNIIVYGSNATDETAINKANQLVNLGFKCVLLYCGGLFEWLLLQEVYGFDEFPTTIQNKNTDLLLYKPESRVTLL
jgi:hypothetical protein